LVYKLTHFQIQHLIFFKRRPTFQVGFNDLIVGVDGEVWKQGRASLPFSEKIKKMKPGTKVTLKVLRDAELMDVVVRLGKRPAGAGPQFFGQMMDLEAAEKSAKEAFFRQWLEARDSAAKAKP
jgi:predicted metalloprotease with PDZ domain